MINLKKIVYNNLNICLHPEIYEPSEDTFQMLESLDFKGDEKVLEIGTGSGIIALELARQGCDVVCTDVNPYAVIFSELNYKNNKKLVSGSVDIRYGDLLSVINDDECFDLIIFNPPYLPYRIDEKNTGSTWFDIAVNGGIDGLFHTFRFLEEVKKHVKADGKIFFVFSSHSDRNKLNSFLKTNNFKNEIMSSYCFDDEQIDVYKIMI